MEQKTKTRICRCGHPRGSHANEQHACLARTEGQDCPCDVYREQHATGPALPPEKLWGSFPEPAAETLIVAGEGAEQKLHGPFPSDEEGLAARLTQAESLVRDQAKALIDAEQTITAQSDVINDRDRQIARRGQEALGRGRAANDQKKINRDRQHRIEALEEELKLERSNHANTRRCSDQRGAELATKTEVNLKQRKALAELRALGPDVEPSLREEITRLTQQEQALNKEIIRIRVLAAEDGAAFEGEARRLHKKVDRLTTELADAKKVSHDPGARERIRSMSSELDKLKAKSKKEGERLEYLEGHRQTLLQRVENLLAKAKHPLSQEAFNAALAEQRSKHNEATTDMRRQINALTADLRGEIKRSGRIREENSSVSEVSFECGECERFGKIIRQLHERLGQQNCLHGEEEIHETTFCLDRARELVCGNRAHDYGDPRQTYGRLASAWASYLGFKKLDGRDVIQMLVIMRALRDRVRRKPDNLVDQAGYAQCAAWIGDPRAPAEIEDHPLKEAADRKRGDAQAFFETAAKGGV